MSQSLLLQLLLDDLVYEILTWVPVKSLIRFRCVSKSWYSTITSHKFIKTHLDRAKSSSNNNNDYLLYKSQRMSSSPNELCTVVHNSDRTLSEISRFQIPDYFVYIVGFCNGMFLSADDDSDHGHVVYLWNPSIRKYKKLPPSHFIHTFGPSDYCFTFGLAYHYQNNDYKILKLIYEYSPGEKVPPAEAEVYTLSTDSWRRFVISVESSSGSRPIGSVDCLNESGLLFFNGALHSIACSEDYKFILSFDVNDERFREILLPQNYLEGVSLLFEGLAVFKGSLTLFVFGEALADKSNLCHLWIMKEYGVVESWTKKTIQRKEAAEFFDCIVDSTVKGECYTFWSFWKLSLDPENLNKEIFRIPNAGCIINATNFVESLVLLDGINISQE